MQFLVTGGLGYIGSHTCVEMISNGYDVVIVDDLSNSNINTIDKIKKITHKDIRFICEDVTNHNAMQKIFECNSFSGIVHFAGFKSVSESVEDPLKYYDNNINSTIVLLDLCIKNHIPNFIFSSSATVYGDLNPPYTENIVASNITSPYGKTKRICEQILQDVAKSNVWMSITALRYFNPIGAHSSGLIGESPKGIPSNLIPIISRVALGQIAEVPIFGNNFCTPDGTGVRDYVHVMDVASGHVCAIQKSLSGFNIFNLGTGKGYSVLEIINTYSKVASVQIPFIFKPERIGDVPISFASVIKAKEVLGWEAQYTLIDMLRDEWNYICKNDTHK